MSPSEKAAIERIKNNKFLTYFVQVWAAILAPLIEAILVNVYTGSTTVPSYLHFIATVVGITHFISFLLLLYMESKDDDALADILETKRSLRLIQKENTEIKEQLIQRHRTGEIVQLMSFAVKFFISEKLEGLECSPALTKKRCEKMLEPLIHYRTEIFRLSANSLFNLAIYLYDEKEGTLKIFHRYHDDRLTTSNRSWEPGFGHVGRAFLHEKMYICDDMAKYPDYSVNGSPTDKKYYRSFASIPLHLEANGKKPIGVLVLTSNQVNEFDAPVYANTLLIIAQLVTIFLEEAKSCIKTGELTDVCI